MPITRQTLSLNQQLRVTVGQEADAATRSLTGAWVRAWDELASSFREACLLAAQAAPDGRWPHPWELQRIDAVGRALVSAGQALTTLASRTGVEVADAAGNAIKATAEYEPRIIASQLPAAERVAAAERFAHRLLPTALDAMVARTQGQIEAASRPLAPDAVEAMRRELVRGVAVGDNPRVAAQRMVDRVQGRFEGGLSRAINIARTESLDAMRVASQYAHSANADVVGGWVWRCTFSKRTCIACIAMNNSEHPVSEPGPSGHPACRCARIPRVRSWRELGINLDEPAGVANDARAWFRDQPEATQLAIAGPTRLGMLQSGAVSFDDLVVRRANPGWRDSYVPVPVRDLQRKAAA